MLMSRLRDSFVYITHTTAPRVTGVEEVSVVHTRVNSDTVAHQMCMAPRWVGKADPLHILVGLVPSLE